MPGAQSYSQRAPWERDLTVPLKIAITISSFFGLSGDFSQLWAQEGAGWMKEASRRQVPRASKGTKGLVTHTDLRGKAGICFLFGTPLFKSRKLD